MKRKSPENHEVSTEVSVKGLSSLVDAVYDLRVKRLAYEHEVNAEVQRMKAQEEALETIILQTCSNLNISEVSGMTAQAKVKPSTHAKLTDWPHFIAWVGKHKAWDLLHKRINDSAFASHIAAGEHIAGVETVTRTALSISKIR